MTATFAGALSPGVRVISLVGVAHMMSHVYQMSMPPLFPILKAELGVSYTALGALLSVFSLTSATGQVPMGFVVDRIGGKAVLLTGLTLQAVAIGLIGFTGSYWSLLALFMLAGLAHSVYHPADYAILSENVAEGKLGRAYTLHSFAGNLGTAATPLLMVGLAAMWDWRAAFIATGLTGILVALAMWSQRSVLTAPADGAGRAHGVARTEAAVRDGIRLLLSPPLLLCFLFFVLLTAGFSGVRMFSVAALVDMYALPLETANGAVTGYILGVAFGMLAGGVIADRIGPHTIIAVVGLLSAAAMLVVIASVSLPIMLLVAVLAAAGFLRGIVQGTRDLMVHAVTPQGSHGKVFAFVSSGSHLGHAAMPLAFGWVLDNADPAWVYWSAAGFAVLALTTFVTVRGRVMG